MGPKIILRPRVGGSNDYGVAYEMFVEKYYVSPRPVVLGDVSRIVDLGANIGFSCLYWLAAYPNSRVIAFEPHPGHVVQAWLNLKLNGLQDRVEVHPAAAGICNRSVTISDEGMASTVKEDGLGALTVEMRDVFPTLLEAPIDILKIDIEGGEYAILGDSRFEGVEAERLVLEWHARADVSDSREWCLRRLQSLGYEISEIFNRDSHGMLWAFRQRRTRRANASPASGSEVRSYASA